MTRNARYWLSGIVTACFLVALVALSVDADETLEAGKNAADGLLLNAQEKARASDPAAIVPGFPPGNPTNLPQTNYYDSQNVEALETDAVFAVDEAAVNQFLWDQSLRPKLEFGDTHPILENADAIGENTVATAQTGSLTTCETEIATTTDPIIDTCLSSLVPEDVSCARTLDVDVTWQDQTNCPVGQGFSQQLAVINTANVDDYVGARAYCNPGAAPQTVELETNGWDAGKITQCGGWNRYAVPTSAPGNTHFLGVFNTSYFGDRCSVNVISTAQGGCGSGQCQYRVDFLQTTNWRFEGGDNGRGYYCQGTVLRDPSVVGLTQTTFEGLPGYGGFPRGVCVAHQASVAVAFQQPQTTRVATVQETWRNGCTAYAARTLQ